MESDMIVPGEKSVTVVISRRVFPGHERDYDEWVRRLVAAATEAPGNTGATMLIPEPGKPGLYHVVLRFAGQDAVHAWEDSYIRQKLSHEADAFSKRGRFFLKLRVGFLEPVRNLDVLRAFFQALPALFALIGARFRFKERAMVHPARHRKIIVNHGVIVKLKDSRYLHAVGTRLAVAAIGTGYGGQAAVGLPHPGDELQVRVAKRTGAGTTGDFNVFHHLRHGAHAA